MIQAYLIRTNSTPELTQGHLLIGKNHLYTLELPYKENKKNISCIPLGKYICIFEDHKTKGMCYRIKDVIDRDGILVCSGNDFVESKGNILVGCRVNKTTIHESKLAMQQLKLFCGEGFNLTILNLGD